jgi:cyclohexanone monooxygenase
VQNPAVAETLIPKDHPIGTKRPPMDDEYYKMFNRQNVRLVDLRTDPIVGFTTDALVTSAGAHLLDTLILATGFDALTGSLLAVDIRGRDGLPLREAWADGARSLLGLAVAGFPNLFLITGPLSPSVLANMPTAIEQHVNWIADCLQELRARGARTIEPLAKPQEEWTRHVAEVAEATLYRDSRSWYFGSNVPGKPRQFGVYVGGFGNYADKCRQVAASGYDGFAIR